MSEDRATFQDFVNIARSTVGESLSARGFAESFEDQDPVQKAVFWNDDLAIVLSCDFVLLPKTTARLRDRLGAAAARHTWRSFGELQASDEGEREVGLFPTVSALRSALEHYADRFQTDAGDLLSGDLTRLQRICQQ